MVGVADHSCPSVVARSFDLDVVGLGDVAVADSFVEDSSLGLVDLVVVAAVECSSEHVVEMVLPKLCR